jgi:hypothetical protein
MKLLFVMGVLLVTLSCIRSQESKQTAPAPDGMTHTLQRSAATTLFFIDQIGSFSNPLSQKALEVSGEEPLVIAGWAVDSQAKTPADGVEVVIDNQAYVARYGLERQDVAQAHKTPAYAASGFMYSAPAQSFGKGRHSLTVRTIARGRQAYYESSPISFTIR